jgi:hypothetical protein
MLTKPRVVDAANCPAPRLQVTVCVQAGEFIILTADSNSKKWSCATNGRRCYRAELSA